MPYDKQAQTRTAVSKAATPQSNTSAPLPQRHASPHNHSSTVQSDIPIYTVYDVQNCTDFLRRILQVVLLISANYTDCCSMAKKNLYRKKEEGAYSRLYLENTITF